MIDNSNEAIFREAAVLSGKGITAVWGKDLLGYLQFKWVANLLPDLLRAIGDVIILETLEVKDKDRG